MSRTDHASHPRCPACDYNLTGLTRSACPECGRDLSSFDLLWTRSRRSTPHWAIWLLLGLFPGGFMLTVILFMGYNSLAVKPAGNAFLVFMSILAALEFPILLIACVVTAGLAAHQLAMARGRPRASDGLIEINLRRLALHSVLFVALQWGLLAAMIAVIWLVFF